MLGQIERNESSPTVATLWKIATGLNVPFSTFISPPQSATPSVYDPQQQAMVITSLFPYVSLYLVCHVLIFLQPYPGPRAGSLLPVLQEKLPVMQLCNAADNT